MPNNTVLEESEARHQGYQRDLRRHLLEDGDCSEQYIWDCGFDAGRDFARSHIEREVIELREALNKAHRAFKGIEREANEGAAYGKKHGAEWWDSSLGVIASSARRNERRLRNLLPSRPDEGEPDA